MAVIVVIVVLVVLAVTWEWFHGLLDDTAPLAGWLVAAGTFVLALATYTLAQRTAEEAKQVALEASAVTKQVELQVEQAAAAVRPLVYPIANEEWTKARRQKLLLVRNGGGPGLPSPLRD